MNVEANSIQNTNSTQLLIIFDTKINNSPDISTDHLTTTNSCGNQHKIGSDSAITVKYNCLHK